MKQHKLANICSTAGTILLALFLWLSCKKDSPVDVPPGTDNGEIPSQMPQTEILWPSLADSPWPMHRHDPQHTGRSPLIGPQLGELDWVDNPVKGADLATGIAVGADGTLYFLSPPYLAALNRSGKEKWRIRFTENQGAYGWPAETTPIIGADGTIYVSSTDNFLNAVNPDGTLKWRASLGVKNIGVNINDLAIGMDGSFYGIGSDRSLYAIDPEGNLSWKLHLDFGFWALSYPAFSPDGSTLYVSGFDSTLYAISTMGRLLWENSLGGRIYGRELLVDNQGNIYVVPTSRLKNVGSELVVLNPDGTTRWTFRFAEAPPTSLNAPTMDSNGYIYLLDWSNSRILSLDYAGKLRWELPIPSDLSGIAPLICDREGTVYAVLSGSNDNIISVTPIGEMRWKASFPQGKIFVAISPTIGLSGRLFVAGNDIRLIFSVK